MLYFKDNDWIKIHKILSTDTESIKIDNKLYKELNNVIYEIPYSYFSEIAEMVPNHIEDEYERQYLLSRIPECIKEFSNEQNSRKAVYANIYQNNMCKCICTVNMYIRKGKLYINEFYRSQNFNSNFFYDCKTACLIMDETIYQLKEKCNLDIQPGIITVFCSNLHKNI